MSALRATGSRESRRALRGARAWAIGAATAALTAVPLFLTSGSAAAMADFGPTLSIAAWCQLVSLALIGAASMSSERRHGTWDLVLAAPGRPAAAVWGKGLAVVVVSGVIATGFLLQGLVESFVTGVDGAAVMAGCIGLLLGGAAAGGVGLLAGAVARSGLASTALALVGVGAWTMLGRTLQVVGDPWVAGVGFAIDPIRRVQGFADGSIDLGSTFSLLVAWASCVWIAARWSDAMRRRVRAQAWRRRLAAVALGVSCMPISAVALRGPGVEPPSLDLHAVFRARASDALESSMREISGTVRLLLLRAGPLGETSLGSARQAIRRAASCAPGRVEVQEIDLLDPLQAGAAAQAIERIAGSEQANAEAWRKAFADGIDAIERIRASAALSDTCRQAATRRPAGDLTGSNLAALSAALQRAKLEGRTWIQAFQTAAAASPERPLGDVEGAGRALGAELGVWAKLLRQGADGIGGAGSSREMREAARRMASLADACRAAQDLVDRLPPLRLSEVASALRAPPVLVVSTETGCAAVPAWRLMEGAASADDAVAASLAAVQGAPRSAAVFVHAMQRSPLEATSPGSDFALVADALRGARLRVEAWNPSQAPRPAVRDARTRAWIVVPPLERRSLEADASEQALLEATQRLLREGEPVFLLTAPSVAAAMGVRDPWAGMLQSQGLEARTGAMLVELSARSETERQLRTTTEEIVPGTHPAAGALRGRVSWPAAIPLQLRPTGPWRAEAIACVPARPSVWIEEDPRVISKGTDRIPLERGVKDGECVPVLAVAEGEGRRVALAGGVSWALSASAGIADVRGALQHPGNRDLFVATVRWLVGDEPASVRENSGRGAWLRATGAILWMPALGMLVTPLIVAASRRRT